MCLYQDEDVRYPPSRASQGGYGAYNAYISAATRYAALGAPTLYDHPGSAYGSKSSVISLSQFWTRSNYSIGLSIMDPLKQEGIMDPLKQLARRYLLVGFHKKQTRMTWGITLADLVES